MNWEAIGAVGEIIGALAVVASLAYLAIQIRHNTKEVEEQNRTHQINTLSDNAGRFTHFRTNIISNAEVASIWQRGRHDLNSLSYEERFRFDSLAEEFFWAFGMFFLYDDIGGIDKVSLELTMSNLEFAALTPGLEQWWSESGFSDVFPEEFAQLVSKMYRDSGNHSSAST